MDEIEAKIIDIDRGKVERDLISRGAKKVFDGELHSIIFDDSDGFLTKANDLLRLRKEGDKVTLTYKGYSCKLNSDDEFVNTRKEYEVEVSDFEAMRSILGKIGLSSKLATKKHRTEYELNGTHFAFDAYLDPYEFVPEFLEIEADSVSAVYEAAEMLGFRREDCKPWDFWDLVKHYSPKDANT